jgi:lysophospholipase L1-like esterase
MGGGHLYGGGAKYQIGNFAHPQATVLDHALENPKSYLRSNELKLAEQFAPRIVVLGPFGDHEALAKVGFENFTKDLRAILDRLAAISSRPTILVALPIPRGPKDEDENYRRIRRETEQVARERKLAVIDLWPPFLGHPEFFKDATHLTIPGRQQLAKLVAAAVAPAQ